MMKTNTPRKLPGLCIHSITTKPWDISVALQKYADKGVGGITVWRDTFNKHSPDIVGRMIRESGLEAVSLCRGGFFPSADKKQRKLAIKDNLQAIDEAISIGAPMVVLVPGADPGQPLRVSRDQIKAGIEAILPYAEKAGVNLAVEPLHPVYADSRSAINTMKQANDLVEYFNSPFLGVAVDVYHVWWDSDLEHEIIRCGINNKLFAFHLCDWKTPTTDILYDRGIMGEGCIDIPSFRTMMKNAGFHGYDEVEIFSNLWWERDQDEYLTRIIEAYRNHVLE